MIENEKGSVIVTGNTSAHRGKQSLVERHQQLLKKFLQDLWLDTLIQKGVHNNLYNN